MHVVTSLQVFLSVVVCTASAGKYLIYSMYVQACRMWPEWGQIDRKLNKSRTFLFTFNTFLARLAKISMIVYLC